MRQITVDAKQFIFQAQTLTLRIHKHQNWQSRSVLDNPQHKISKRECGIHTNCKMVGGPHNSDLALRCRTKSGEDTIRIFYRLSCWKQFI